MPFITQGKTNLKYILIVVILAVIVGGGILGYYYSWIKELDARLAELELRLPEVQPPEVRAPEVEPSKGVELDASTLLDIPELFPGLSWSEVSVSESLLGEYALYYDNFGFEKDGSVSFKGREWLALQKGLCGEEPQNKTNAFQEYYKKELSDRGWKNEIVAKGFRIMPLSADRPGGSIYGYVRMKDEKLRVILLNYGTLPLFDCPFETKFRVFISEILSLNEILPIE